MMQQGCPKYYLPRTYILHWGLTLLRRYFIAVDEEQYQEVSNSVLESHYEMFVSWCNSINSFMYFVLIVF